jgi:aryl-alcohol dehydrogenase-like predicted oxidoreductase
LLLHPLLVTPLLSPQNDFSPFLRVYEGELAEACAPSNYNIGLLAYGVLLGGTLSGKYLNGYEHSKGRHSLFAGESWGDRGVESDNTKVVCVVVFTTPSAVGGHTMFAGTG